MKCPNCGKEMIDKSYSKFEEFYHFEDEQYYYRNVHHDEFVCKDCKISFKDNRWTMPFSMKQVFDNLVFGYSRR